MKSMWNVVSFIAVVNLVALIIFGAWLWGTDRISVDRLREIKAMLSVTVHDANAAEEEDAERAERESTAADEATRRQNPRLPSVVEVARTIELSEKAQQASRHLEDQSRQHVAELNLRIARLDAREAALAAKEEAWQARVGTDLDTRTEQQFLGTVKLYEALAGKQAKRMLLQLVTDGMTDQAVAYLDAMSPRAAAKTLKEFKTDPENELATELLEKLRTLGIDAGGVETVGNDDPARFPDTLASPLDAQ